MAKDQSLGLNDSTGGEFQRQTLYRIQFFAILQNEDLIITDHSILILHKVIYLVPERLQ